MLITMEAAAHAVQASLSAGQQGANICIQLILTRFKNNGIRTTHGVLNLVSKLGRELETLVASGAIESHPQPSESGSISRNTSGLILVLQIHSFTIVHFQHLYCFEVCVNLFEKQKLFASISYLISPYQIRSTTTILYLFAPAARSVSVGPLCSLL